LAGIVAHLAAIAVFSAITERVFSEMFRRKGVRSMMSEDQHGRAGTAVSSATTVTFGNPGTEAASFQSSQLSTRTFEDVLTRLRKEIEGAGLRVLSEIDPQKALQGIGRSTRGSRLIFFFHPELVVRVLETDWSAMVEAPLKLVVTELPEGTVSIRMADPIGAFGRYGNPALASFGKELAATCQRIIGASV
jgi:uncharacterized protein (DUF302 family)